MSGAQALDVPQNRGTNIDTDTVGNNNCCGTPCATEDEMAQRFLPVAALVAVLMVGCSTAPAGPSATPPPASEPPTPAPASAMPERTAVNMVVASSPDFTQISLPKWQDLVAESGIELSLEHVEATDNALRAVVSGAADIYVGSLTPLIRAVQETGVDLKLIAIDSQATDYIFGAQEDVADLEDLAGRPVAIGSAGDLTESVIRAATARAGFPDLADELEFVPIGGTPARVAALLSGQVDMSPLHAPDGITAMAEDPTLKSLLTAADHLDNYLQTGLITSQGFIDENPVLTQLLVDRFLEANRWAADNKDEYIDLADEVVPDLSREVRSQSYDTFQEIGLFAVNGGMKADQLEAFVETVKSTGGLPEDAPPPSEWSDSSFVEDYLARNGER